MRVQDIILAETKADPDVVEKFAQVSDSQRSYYIMKWAEEKGIDTDDAMEMAGYEKGSYRGYGSYDWHYNPPRESLATEAPVGLLKQVGRKVGAKALGAVGAKATAAGLSGAAETGDVARQLNVDLKKYAGQTGMNLKQLDAQDLVAFLKSKGFPTTPLANVTGVLAPKQIDQALLKAAQEKAKVGGAKASTGVAGSNAASGKPAAAGAPAQPAKAGQAGGVLDKIQQKTGKTAVGGGTVAPGAKPGAPAAKAKPGAPNPQAAKQIAAVKAKIQKLNAQQKQELVGMI